MEAFGGVGGFPAENAVRLLAAVLCGVLIGFNRDRKQKAAGVRTLGLVALGACLVSLAALHEPSLHDNADALSRIIQGVLQGVMTGVGFIGAGVILKQDGSMRVRGLTTAAAVWLTAALGIVCALADWTLAAMGVVLALLVLSLPRHVARIFGDTRPDDDYDE
ncbi:MgtC/SapB family protein [Hansschlegelia plantiphila]|uniref:Protein MgtC n=1 Tax=Hansschlegelia plantiphila TaxID=374655 RepID=A0A9W6MX15_9HYPH|nr:MgtC/SapB family protein [Hansschlegelia plantiphila]GLK69581.1 magnesium transporter [Hansschlegelia plantiphila]